MTTPAQQAIAAKIVVAAKSQLGVPYVYGGEDPGVGFDCSGLTQWCCSQAGISIPRGSAAQFTASGPRINGMVESGDLVFFYGGEASGPRPGHVGIVTSAGLMINAPYTGVNVGYDNYSPTVNVGPLDYYGATRPALLVPGSPLPPPPANVCVVNLPVLQSGASGDAVKSLQVLLKGQLGNPLAVDGIFGVATEVQVKTYQDLRHLTVDGIVGTHTWGALLGAPQ